MKGEGNAETAAREYEKTIGAVLNVSHDQPPRFDLILLGLGRDGHTASLFPGTPAVNERVRWVVPGTAPGGISARLTLTLNVINHAAVMLFLVAGQDKAPITRIVLEPASAAHPCIRLPLCDLNRVGCSGFLTRPPQLN